MPKMIRIFSSQFLKISVIPKIKCELIRNISTSSCIRYSKFTAQEIADRKRQDNEMRWTKLYHYTNIKYHAIVTRLKIYPALATLFLTPASILLEAQQIIPASSFLACLACGITGTVTLSTYSAALANTIGVIYKCKENKNLQIAYIDFLGRQNFVETTADELRKCEKGPVKFGAYKTIKVNDGKEDKVLKMPWNTGDIYDIKLFRRVFGK